MMVSSTNFSRRILYALLTCSLFMWALPSVNAQQVDGLIKKGDSLHLNSKYSEAAEVFAESLELIDPKASERVAVLHKQADALMNSNETAKAEEALNEALNLAIEQFGAESAEVSRTYYFLTKNIAYQRNRAEDALSFGNKALEIGRKLEQTSPVFAGNALIMLGRVHMINGEYQKALTAYEEALVLMADVTDETILREKTWAYNGLAWVNITLQNLLTAVEFLNQSLEINERLFSANHGRLANDLRLLGIAYTQLGQFDNAINTLSRSLDIQLATFGKNHLNTANTYNSMAKLFFDRGDFNEAIDYGIEAQRIRLAINGKSDPALLSTYSELASYYREIKQHPAELEMLNSAVEIARTVRKDNPNLISLYSRLVLHLINREQFEEADNILEQMEALILKLVDRNHPVYGDLIALKSKKLKAQGQFTESLKGYQQSLKLLSSRLSPHNVKQVSRRIDLGEAFHSVDMFDSALFYFDQALTFARNDPEPDPNQVVDFDDIYHPLLYTTAMVQKARVFRKMSKQESQTAHLKKSLTFYQDAIIVFEGSRNRLISKQVGSSLFQLEGTIYEEATDVCFTLFKLTGDNQYMDAFFQLSERSKGYIFLREISQKQSLRFGNVPDSLVEQNLDQISELRYLANLSRNAIQRNQLETAKKYRDKYFSAKTRHDSLYQIIAREYPDFYGLRYRPEVLSLEEAKQSLNSKGPGILSFVVNKENLFIQLITPQGQWLEKVSAPASLAADIAKFRKSYADYAFISDSTAVSNQLFIEKGNQLYQQLISPVAAGLASVENLVIVPHEGLYDLNFELLLSKKIDGSFKYKDLPYLLKQHSITYTNSYTVHHKLQRLKTSPGTRIFGGFATDLLATNNQLEARNMANVAVRSPGYSAKATLTEVSEIAGLLNGDSFLNEEATEGNFKDLSNNYQILHLAMHGDVDNRNQNNSALIFSEEPDGSEDGLLTVDEIYRMRLKSDLVVLSACNTGYNDLTINGEGMMSMSRGFMFSGVPAMVMSLWSIPDETTAQIMVGFYENLNNGDSKPEALRSAKLNFLAANQEEFYDHPFFWAGLSHTGNTRAMSFNSGSSWYYWLLALLIVAFFVWVQKQRKSRHQVE